MTVSGYKLELVLGAVRAACAGRVVEDHLIVFPSDHWSRLFVAPAPSAYPDHLVVFGPVGEGVVRGVEDNESAAFVHIIDKGLLCFDGPVVACVVHYDYVVFCEFGLEGVHSLAACGRRGDIYLEYSGLFEQGL